VPSRPLAITAVCAGACWIVFAVLSLVGGETTDAKLVLSSTGDYVGFGHFALSLGLTVPVMLGLRQAGRLGHAGAIVAAAGVGLQCIVISAILVNGEETSWFGVAAPLAILTWFAGSVALGVAIRRARVLPGWFGIVLPIATLFAIVGSDYGTSVLLGGLLVALGSGAVQSASARSRIAPASAPAGNVP